MKFEIDNLKKNMLPLIFTILGIEIVLYSYLGKIQIVSSSIIFILTIGFFSLYDYIDTKEKTGVIIYIVSAIIIFCICYVLSSIIASIDSVGFFNWFFSTQNKASDESFYTIPLSISLSFIFSSMYYYFTVKIIRMPVLLLLVFVDLILFIRGPYKIGNIFVCLYLLCFILMFVKKTKEGNITSINTFKHKDYKSTFFISGGIIIIALVIALVIPSNPLPNVSFLNGLKAYFRELKFSSYSNNFNVQENIEREINTPGNYNEDEVLYTYKGEKVEYLITHSFDYFNNEKNMWQRKVSDYKVGYRFGSERLSVPIEKTKKNLQNVNELKGDLASIAEKEKDNTIVKNVEIELKSDKFNEFAHPENTYEGMNLKGNRFVYLNKYEQFFSSKNSFSFGDKYDFLFVSDTPKEGSMEDSLLKYFNEKRYKDYLNQISSTDNEFYEILDNYTKLDKSTSHKLISLAKSITQNKVSYYDKAKAIEDYFKSGKYKYNLDIKNINKDNYIDYFIFDAKEGYCVQYATAMTLMCRAVGVPARYTEGFLIKDEDKTKYGYEVNSKNAHAFTQVYIPGYGWKIFDATPASLTEENADNSKGISLNINIKYVIIAAISIVTIITITIIIILILKLTKRRRTIRKILKEDKEEALEEIIKYSVLLLKEIGLTFNKEETLLNFAKKVDRKINIGFLEIVNKYYLIKYAREDVSDIDIKKALENNEKIYIYLKETENLKD